MTNLIGIEEHFVTTDTGLPLRSQWVARPSDAHPPGQQEAGFSSPPLTRSGHPSKGGCPRSPAHAKSPVRTGLL
jgi:hypothetical protein